jgi:acyl dehydratase
MENVPIAAGEAMTARTYYFEDLPAGTVLEFGGVEMTEEEIVGFARRYDPQPFHLDREAGKSSIFGGLCASGWNTTAVMMRMWVDNYLSPEASLGSPGIDELRWLRPVFPGDRLRCRLTVLESTPSRSRPYMGSVRQRGEVLNQKDEVVLTLIGTSFFRRRPT